MTPRRSLRSAAPISAVLALVVVILPDPGRAETDWLRFPKRDAKETVRESVYNYLIINRDGPVVRFRRLENGATVSAIDLSRPTRQVVPYTAALFTAALVKPDPRSVLNIGLGAGAFDRLFVAGFPEARLTTVEIDQMILEAAKTFTAFHETEHSGVAIADGRRYLQRHTELWDWVVLDAYVRNSQVPVHLTTMEFYKVVADRLSEGGVFVVNLHGGSALFQSSVKTLAAAFPQVVFLQVPDSGNVIGIAVKFRDRDLMQLITRATTGDLPAAVTAEVDFARLKPNLRPAGDMLLRRNTRLLTDDFAPVEFLDLQPE